MANPARKRVLELSELGGPFRSRAPSAPCATCPDYIRRILGDYHQQQQQSPQGFALYPPNAALNDRIYLVQGDITRLRVDAVQNAANRSLLGGGGIDGAIHRAAGPRLLAFNRRLKGCPTGGAKVAPGFDMPSKYIVHTVGPIGERPNDLWNAYWNTLEAAFNGDLPELTVQPAEGKLGAKRKQPEPGVRSLALCGVSTGIYGYPLIPASHVALNAVRQWLENPVNQDKVDAIVFCTFLDQEFAAYSELIPYYFPPPAAAGAVKVAENAPTKSETGDPGRQLGPGRGQDAEARLSEEELRGSDEFPAEADNAKQEIY